MAQYIVRTPNTDYEGKSVGVRFNHGEAFVNDYTIDKHLKLDLATVIARLGELGYEIVEVMGEPDKVRTEFAIPGGGSAFPSPVVDQDREARANALTEPVPAETESPVETVEEAPKAADKKPRGGTRKG